MPANKAVSLRPVPARPLAVIRGRFLPGFPAHEKIPTGASRRSRTCHNSDPIYFATCLADVDQCLVQALVAQATVDGFGERTPLRLLLPQDRDDLLLSEPRTHDRPPPCLDGLCTDPEEFQGPESRGNG